MSVDITIPEVGESITSGVIAAWTKQDGQWVERDETVIELETDKITMEIPAPASGVLKTSAAEGDEVDVGSVVGSIDDSAKKPAGGSSSESASKSKEAESSSERGEPARAATAEKPKAEEPKGDTPAVRAAPSSNGSSKGPSASSGGETYATPLARKIAQEHGVDLGSIRGTGPGSRVREQDVLAAVQSRRENGAAAAATPPTVAALSGKRSSSRKKMSPLRRRIAARLVEAQQTAAMLTTFNECDMTAVIELRKTHKERFLERHGVGLGFMSFFVKAAVSSLKTFPNVNASIVSDEGTLAIESHDYYDISIAVSSKKGLVVPVLRNCDDLSFSDIESGIKDLAARAQDGKLDLDELSGGTFTITNGGVFGSMMSTPILNPPQSAILGMHAIKNRAVEDPDSPGQVVIRPMMYLAVSYDHRIIDGSEAVGFLKHIKESIEDPERLMFDL